MTRIPLADQPIVTSIELDAGNAEVVRVAHPVLAPLNGVQIRDGNWGIDPSGKPYYNALGVPATDVATLSVDNTGTAVLGR